MKNDNGTASNQLKIWLIQHGEPLPVLPKATSLRTARLSKELASRGHDVTYWCSSLWHHKKIVYCSENKEMKVDGYNLSILHAGAYKSNHSFDRYLHHRKMAKLFSEEARKREKPDIIVAGLPIHYCAYEAVRFGNENHIPVIVDIRDYWPDNLLMLFPKKLQWIGRLVLSKDFEVTRFAMTNATSIVSMMSHMLEWGIKKYAKRNRNDDDRVFFIGGDEFSNGRSIDAIQTLPVLNGKINDRFVVNYIGGFSFLNHPLVIIEAAKYLNSIGQKDRILFVLAGNGDYYQRCVKSAKGLENVIFLGWLDPDGIIALNSISSVGVIPSMEEFSFPNKAFSYLEGGLPILSSENGDLHSLLEQYEAGYYFDISDPIQLANRILDLCRLDKESYKKISENSKTLFRNHLRASEIYKQFADYVEDIACRYACGVNNNEK